MTGDARWYRDDGTLLTLSDIRQMGPTAVADAAERASGAMADIGLEEQDFNDAYHDRIEESFPK